MRQFRHPIALLRYVLGPHVTQKQFAESLGVSESLIRAVENGQRVMSDELAFSIEVRYGVPVAKLKGDLHPVGTLEFEATVLTFYVRAGMWEFYGPRKNADAESAFDEILLPALRAMLRKAVAKNRATGLLMSFDKWIDAASEEFGLRVSRERYYSPERKTGAQPQSLFTSSDFANNAVEVPVPSNVFQRDLPERLLELVPPMPPAEQPSRSPKKKAKSPKSVKRPKA